MTTTCICFADFPGAFRVMICLPCRVDETVLTEPSRSNDSIAMRKVVRLTMKRLASSRSGGMPSDHSPEPMHSRISSIT